MSFFDDYISMEVVKSHCRIYHDEDDNEIEIYCNAALDLLSSNINRKILKKGEKQDNEDDSYPCELRPAIIAAMLLLISDLYNNRESNLDVSTFENRTFILLTSPFRNILTGQA